MHKRELPPIMYSKPVITFFELKICPSPFIIERTKTVMKTSGAIINSKSITVFKNDDKDDLP